jgi:hypothetical protein
MPLDRLRRREFIRVVGGAAVAWPLTARSRRCRWSAFSASAQPPVLTGLGTRYAARWQRTSQERQAKKPKLAKQFAFSKGMAWAAWQFPSPRQGSVNLVLGVGPSRSLLRQPKFVRPYEPFRALRHEYRRSKRRCATVREAATAMGVAPEVAVKTLTAPVAPQLDLGDGRYRWKPWRDVAPPHPDVMSAPSSRLSSQPTSRQLPAMRGSIPTAIRASSFASRS